MASKRRRRRTDRLSAAEKRRIGTEWERRWSWALVPALRVAADIKSASARPATTRARMEADVSRALQRRIAQVGPEAVVSDMVGDWIPLKVLHAMRAELPDKLDGHRRAIARSPVRDGLLCLMERAHARVPFSPFLAFRHPQEGFEATLDAIHREIAFKKATGLERRARLLAERIAAFAEASYRPYLEQLWILDGLTSGKLRRPRQRPRLGDLARNLAAYGALYESTCAKVRNAVLHDGARFDVRARVTRSPASWTCRELGRGGSAHDRLAPP
jgi:hypothetical protein